MRILIDTHILLWYVDGNLSLKPSWRELLQDPTTLKMVSMVSLWKIAIKTNIKKLTINYPLDKFVPIEFQILDIAMPHFLAYQSLPLHHKDPFDRLLIAQAQIEDLKVMTIDQNFPFYEVDLVE